MKEGDTTVLDNSCLLFVSNMWSGSKHDSSKVPLLLVGGLGGKLDTGRVLDYRDEGRRQAQALRTVPVHHESHGRDSRHSSATRPRPSLASRPFPRHTCPISPRLIALAVVLLARQRTSSRRNRPMCYSNAPRPWCRCATA